MGKLLSLRGMILLEQSPGVFAVHTVKGLRAELIGTTVSIPKTPKRLLYTDGVKAEKQAWMSFFTGHGLRLVVPLLAQEKVVGIAGFAAYNALIVKSPATQVESMDPNSVRAAALTATASAQSSRRTRVPRAAAASSSRRHCSRVSSRSSLIVYAATTAVAVLRPIDRSSRL